MKRTFIGYSGEEWAWFVEGEWQIASCSVHDCIEEAEKQGFTVDYEEEGEKFKINSLTRNG